MITLYAFGPAFGLPDPSPFVLKVETLLKMCGRAYRITTDGLGKAPKGKLPYIDDDGETVADSTFIRWHIERKYDFDFDRGLDAEQRSIAWALEKMVEDNLYWTLLDSRWNDDANFYKGAVAFFAKIPAPLRPIVIAMIRRQIRKALRAHGMGRHSAAEIVAIATRSIDAIADYLGDKAFVMGAEPIEKLGLGHLPIAVDARAAARSVVRSPLVKAALYGGEILASEIHDVRANVTRFVALSNHDAEPTGVDATMFAFVAGALCPVFDTPIRAAAERHDNLKRYVGRMTARFYPGLGEIAGIKAAA